MKDNDKRMNTLRNELEKLTKTVISDDYTKELWRLSTDEEQFIGRVIKVMVLL